MDALQPFKCPTSAIAQDPVVLPYLRDPDYSSFDIKLEARLVRFSLSTSLFALPALLRIMGHLDTGMDDLLRSYLLRLTISCG